jgi:hypothetical protein
MTERVKDPKQIILARLSVYINYHRDSKLKVKKIKAKGTKISLFYKIKRSRGEFKEVQLIFYL